MATSPNYAWAEPDNSSLVKNGAADIRTLGDAIDTSVWNIGYGQAGKNRVINGDFNIWQRGTSFTFAGTGGYTSDRFLADSGSGGTVAVTRQTFTAGQTDVPNAVYFYQAAYSVSGTTPVVISTRLEDVNTLAGQAATFSFYAKINTGTQSITPRYVQDFGSGGSATVVTNMTAQTLTTSWQRFTIASTIPSVSGKTIGTSSYLRLDLLAATSGTLTYQIANVQLEYGSKATPFQTATGTIQGELAACQRYYFKMGNESNAYNAFGLAAAASINAADMITMFPVKMRTAPTAIESTAAATFSAGSVTGITSIAYNSATNTQVAYTALNKTSGFTDGRTYPVYANNSTSAYFAWSAEL